MTKSMPHDNRERVYVVFQGGGALGVAHFGVWKVISESFEIAGAAGTSSGSIAAALCAAGCDPEETFRRFREKWTKFFKYKNLFEAFFHTLIPSLIGRDNSGDGNELQAWLEEELKHSTQMDKVTFENLYENREKYLEIITCDLNDHKRPSVIYSPFEKKYKEVACAVRESIALPILLKAVPVGNRILVDGGFKNNFPVQTLYKRAKEKGYCFIGVRFIKQATSVNSSNPIQNFLRGTKFLTENGISPEFEDEIRKDSRSTLIEIEDRGLNAFKFDLDDRELDELYKLGEDVALDQLQELKERLAIVKARLYSNLNDEVRELVAEAQNFLEISVKPKAVDYCEAVLKTEAFQNFEFNDDDRQDLYFDVENYIERISESLLRDDHELLNVELPGLQPSILLSSLYLNILDEIDEYIPPRISFKGKISKLICYLKKQLEDYIERSKTYFK